MAHPYKAQKVGDVLRSMGGRAQIDQLVLEFNARDYYGISKIELKGVVRGSYGITLEDDVVFMTED